MEWGGFFPSRTPTMGVTHTQWRPCDTPFLARKQSYLKDSTPSPSFTSTNTLLLFRFLSPLLLIDGKRPIVQTSAYLLRPEDQLEGEENTTPSSQISTFFFVNLSLILRNSMAWKRNPFKIFIWKRMKKHQYHSPTWSNISSYYRTKAEKICTELKFHYPTGY